MRKNTFLRGSLAAALTGFFILTMTSGEARRAHDPNMTTKVRTERGAEVEKKKDFRMRIDMLIKEAETANAVAAEQAKVQPLFSVPQTLSEYDTAIIGTPLASQEQCVDYLLSVNPYPEISVTPRELVPTTMRKERVRVFVPMSPLHKRSRKPAFSVTAVR